MAKTTAKKSSHANRGKDFEKLIESKCKEYKKNNIAIIEKIPTDWVVIRKYDPIKKISNIAMAYPREQSICDYLGSYKGKAIALEAKKTDNKTSFPFSNIKEHQINFLKQWCDNGSLGYYIIWFKELNKTFLVKSTDMQNAIDTLGRKSAPIDWFDNNGILLDEDMNFIEHCN